MPHQGIGRGGPRKPRASLARKQARTAYLFVLPQVVGLLAFTAVPLVVSLGYSFTHWDLIASKPTFIGLDNWRYLLADRRVPRVLMNTLMYIAVATTSFVLFSLLAALVTYKPRRFVALYRAGLFMPYVLSQIGVGIVWRWMFNSQTGPITKFVEMFGVNSPAWLLDPRTAMMSIAMVTTWQAIGYGMTLFVAALNGVPNALIEAATIDGANRFQRFRHIFIPAISPTIFFLMVTSLIGALQLFDPVIAMTETGGGPSTAGGPLNSTRTLVLYMYNQMFHYSERMSGLGYAATLAWMLALLTFIITAIQFAVSRRWVYYESSTLGGKRKKGPKK